MASSPTNVRQSTQEDDLTRTHTQKRVKDLKAWEATGAKQRTTHRAEQPASPVTRARTSRRSEAPRH
eukprot:760260-Hanusia_phi.AAC.1